MRWEERLLAVLDDLEQQAEGLALVARDSEVAELSRAEYAQVDLAGRLHASVGRGLSFSMLGAGTLTGALVRVGRDWCLVRAVAQEWVVALAAVTQVRGLSPRALAEPVRPLGARLGIGSALRGVAEQGTAVVVRTVDGATLGGRLGRVGADFVEVRLHAGEDGPLVVPFSALAAVGSA